jgi:hypothetical protein
MNRRMIASLIALTLLSVPAAAKNMFIPISAVAQGANNTLFRTDVRIFNPNPDLIAVTLHFLPLGQDGANIPGQVLNIPPRQMLVLDNIVQTTFGRQPNSLGAIRLDSDNTGTSGPEFTADSRTYTDSPNPAAPGTFGQFIPALELSRATNEVVVLHLSNSSNLSAGFRTNSGVMNPNRETATVTPRLFQANGTLIRAGAPFTVPPMSVIQQGLPAMIGQSPLDFTDGYLVLESDRPIYGYSSVVDNRSSDQIFVVGAPD